MPKKLIRAYFSGHVQGVGFRYTTVHMASKFNIAGYVRNLDDGRVEIVAEGEVKELNEFIEKILKSPLKKFIYGHVISYGEANDFYSGFKIAY